MIDNNSIHCFDINSMNESIYYYSADGVVTKIENRLHNSVAGTGGGGVNGTSSDINISSTSFETATVWIALSNGKDIAVDVGHIRIKEGQLVTMVYGKKTDTQFYEALLLNHDLGSLTVIMDEDDIFRDLEVPSPLGQAFTGVALGISIGGLIGYAFSAVKYPNSPFLFSFVGAYIGSAILSRVFRRAADLTREKLSSEVQSDMAQLARRIIDKGLTKEIDELLKKIYVEKCATSAAVPTLSISDEIKKLSELLQSGAITKDEFTQFKEKLI